jgi:hypothetical protein
MPQGSLKPFRLKAGAIAGFSLFVTDNDADLYEKTSRTLTPPQTGGWRNPHLYPVMLLTN